jgi:hypothetical protein
MMLKLNWGTRIAMLYIGFVALIAVMITLSMRQKIELVSDDYYDKELVFQTKIDEMNNANALSGKVDHSIEDNFFVIHFPTEFKDRVVSGNVLFFRPSDSSKDLKTEIKLYADLKQHIDLKSLSKGMYKMQVSWIVNNTPYFSEETIVIP